MNKPISVKDAMTTAFVAFNADMDLIEASHSLVVNGISGAPVVNEQGLLVGILTERDCFKTTLNAGYHGELAGKVSDYMTRDVVTVNPDMSLLDLAVLFLKNRYRRYPVVSEKRVVGIISRRDVLNALLTLS
ncbi:MAG TPA: CBS domain-containing protein [Gammaproteobacteria bacterium]|nr:CBS domain-containing protein [Gammaproteobacteria bacterium]